MALDLRREDGRLSIAARAIADLDGPLTCSWRASFRSRMSSIEHGENAGHTYSYMNIVTDLQKVGRWDPSEPLVDEGAAIARTTRPSP